MWTQTSDQSAKIWSVICHFFCRKSCLVTAKQFVKNVIALHACMYIGLLVLVSVWKEVDGYPLQSNCYLQIIWLGRRKAMTSSPSTIGLFFVGRWGWMFLAHTYQSPPNTWPFKFIFYFFSANPWSILIIQVHDYIFLKSNTFQVEDLLAVAISN